MHPEEQIINFIEPILGDGLGYAVLFVATTLESFPLLGFLVPGGIITAVSGYLAKDGLFDFWTVVGLAFLGITTGDLFSYWLGRKYGYKFLLRIGKYFYFKEEHYEKTKKLISGHVGKTLILGRFAAVTKALLSFVLGSTHTAFKKFLFCNTIGAFLWALIFTSLGYLFGQSFEIATRYLGRFFLLAIILGIVIAAAYRFANKRKHVFEKYHLYVLIINIISLLTFLSIADEVKDGGIFTRLDLWVNSHIAYIQTPFLLSVALTLTQLFKPITLVFLSILLFIFFIYKKKKYGALLLALSLSSGLLVEIIMKTLVARPRPDNALLNLADASFPSGHATMATIFFLLFWYSFRKDIKDKILKNIFTITCALLFVAIGLSRIYINVHWMSDVTGGFALGMFWLTLLILIFKYAGVKINKQPRIKE
jgi:undecaprenyl-diphosphatase